MASICLRNRAFYIFSEVLIRLVLIGVFMYTEVQEPFERLIQPEEWWLYKNPISLNPRVSTLKLYVCILCWLIFLYNVFPYIKKLYTLLLCRINPVYHYYKC
uniref:Uncharacterized protein n=1 Tax=Ciona intestinalis TaxID=7719 RepID=H2XUU1_CIOIN